MILLRPKEHSQQPLAFRAHRETGTSRDIPSQPTPTPQLYLCSRTPEFPAQTAPGIFQGLCRPLALVCPLEGPICCRGSSWHGRGHWQSLAVQTGVPLVGLLLVQEEGQALGHWPP
ncbi:hypothetical protein AAY473_034184 [Plecturocebus cupreus]